MKTRFNSLTIITILILAIIVTIDFNFEIMPRVSSATITVDDSGGADYTTIQEAVDAANPGDTVYVFSGTYNENVWIDKSITLTGQKNDTTIIEGVGGGQDAVEIRANWVIVTGFTIKNDYGSTGFGGILLLGRNNVTVSNNIITTLGCIGIQIHDMSSYNLIENNIVYSNGVGIYMNFYTSYNNIVGNIIHTNSEGIWVEAYSYNNVFYNNYITNNSEGILLQETSNNNITDNNIKNNDYGMNLLRSNSDIIYNNNIVSNNIRGIFVDQAHKNMILDNNISSNGVDGIILYNAKDNNINSNSISSNNRYGIYLEWDSNNNNISNNDISSNEIGINNYRSLRNSILGNNLTANGIFIDGMILAHWNTHDIDTANTIDGKPLYYYKNGNGIVVPNGASQVILANCTNVTIENENLNNPYVGIELGFSSNNKIINTTIDSAKYGVYLYSSKNNTILNSSISNINGDDLLLKSDSHIISINSHFNESNTILYDSKSSLTVKWFLNVNVTDYMGNPVPNANVNIEDNTNGTYDKTYVTDGNGYLRWIPLTEYIKLALKKTYNTPHKITAWNETLVGYSYPRPFIDRNMNVNITLYNGTLMDLEPGWNLVSLPRIQSDTNLQTVLKSIEGQYDAVQWYNVTDSNDPWKHNHISKPSNWNDLNEINHTMGLWVQVTDLVGTTLVVFGDVLTSTQNITLYPGWNLVGYPSTTDKTRIAALNNVLFDTEVDAIWTYNATTQTWKEITASDNFEVGRGYWIHSKVTKTWIVPI